MSRRKRTCVACQTTLRPIQVVDQKGGAVTSIGLAYLLEGAPKMGVWKSEVKNRDGVVHGYLCEACDRVFWFAEPGA